MKKVIWYVLFLVLLVATIALCLLRFGDNQATVTYKGDANTIVAEELFPAEVALMPGDSISQVITLKNSTPDAMVKFYIRAQGSDTDSLALLEELNFLLTQENPEADKELTVGLADWIYLGELAPGQKQALEVSLQAPIEMDNQYQAAVSALHWEFMAEEVYIPGASVEHNYNWLLSGCLILAFVLLAMLFFHRKKQTPTAVS